MSPLCVIDNNNNKNSHLHLCYVIFKMDVEKSAGQDARKRNSKRKFRSTRRKKRKGFLGSRKHEVERERSDMLPTASVMVEESLVCKQRKVPSEMGLTVTPGPGLGPRTQKMKSTNQLTCLLAYQR